MITFNIENIGKRSSDSPFLENNQLIKTMFVSVLDTALWRKYSRNKHEIKTSIAFESSR